ncbi:MAG TPA: endonuclease/exonuclease/phosphatase family protein [Bryobacteraceae bacterium]|nr:endonuclease/exonuclease/phosphatase family protein [Candidatus Acidoferrales bacterium]
MTDLQEIEAANFAQRPSLLLTPQSIRVVDWNIDRGLQLSAIIEFLAAIKAELVLLQEVDLNARRTHRLDIAKEIARRLRMNYVFGREFEELSQGGKTSRAYQGQATLSRWPLFNARLIRFREQSTFWRPRWYLPRSPLFQERLGGRIALVAEVHAGARTLVTYNLHLESRGDDRLRRAQLREVLADARQYGQKVPLIIAGDLNLDVSQDRVATDIRRAMLLNAFSGMHVPTTTPRSIFDHGRIIDWLFSRGPLQVAQSAVHRSVRASDHYPLSVRVDLL